MDNPSRGTGTQSSDSSRAAIEAMPNLVKKVILMWKSRELGEAYRMIEQGDRDTLAPMGISPWLDPLSVGSSRESNIPLGGARPSQMKAKAQKRGLLARIFSIR